MASAKEAAPRLLQDADIIAATGKCEELFEKISVKLRDEKSPLLSPFGLALLQQHVAPGSRLSVAAMLERRLAQIRSRELRILIAGEMASGKTTLLNILMGGSYLPMSHGKTTKFVCEIRHSTEQKAIIQFVDKKLDDVKLELPFYSGDRAWIHLQNCIKTGRWEDNDVQRAVIYWPLCLVEQSRYDNTNKMEIYSDKPEDLQRITSTAEYKRAYANAVATDNQTHDNVNVLLHNKACERDGRNGDSAITDDGNLAAGKHADHDVSDREDTCDPSTGTLQNEDDQASDDATGDAEQTLVKQPISVDSSANSETSTKTIYSRTTIANGDEETKDFDIVFIDCPGIEDKDVNNSFMATLENVLSCQAFMFVIDTFRHHGVDKNRIRCRNAAFTNQRCGEVRGRLQRLMSDVETMLGDNDVALNPDTSLFIANKFDSVPTDVRSELQDEILHQLKEKWPLIEHGHLMRGQGSTILCEMVKGDTEARDGFYKQVRAFIEQAARLTLEEHCMWLLNLLEVAYAIVRTGKRWSELNTTKLKLDQSLRNTRRLAIELLEKLRIKDDEQIRQAYCKRLNELLSNKCQDIQNITWDVEEIRTLLPNTLVAGPWENVVCKLTEAICVKISDIVFATTAAGKGNSDIVKSYKVDMQQHYKHEIKQLEHMQKCLSGVVPSGGKEIAI